MSFALYCVLMCCWTGQTDSCPSGLVHQHQSNLTSVSGLLLTQCPLGDMSLIFIAFISGATTFSGMAQDPITEATLFRVMAWWRQATSHCPKPCWLRFLTPHRSNIMHQASRTPWLQRIDNFLPNTHSRHPIARPRGQVRLWLYFMSSSFKSDCCSNA